MVVLKLILAVPLYAQAQATFEIRRGERPSVYLENISEDAWIPGKIRIKIRPEIYELFLQGDLLAGASGFVETGHKDFDSLNREYEIISYKQVFSSLYETNSRSAQHIERHKAWGFHLWYELSMNTKQDLTEVINQFLILDDVMICEPEYKKHLVIDDPGFQSKVTGNNINHILSDGWVPNDLQYCNQWHYHNAGQQGGTPGADISLQAAWEIEKGNSAVIVAIIDGGIDFSHNDLSANMWNGIGYNFVNSNNTILPNDHGTHVAGTVAAASNNGIGVAGIAGGSGSGDGVRLMSCQVFTNTSNGGFHLAPVYAADNGASISQNSWGYTNPGVYEQLVLDAIDYFNVNGGGEAMDGGISIFAAGNSSSTGQWYPACYSGAFSVAATNNNDLKTWYSNYDTWVDISAPGGETNTEVSRGVLSTTTANTYAYYQGTSMACPHVSGVASLLLSNAYGYLNANEIADILRNTSDDISNLNPSYTNMLGAGRLNAYAAMLELQFYFTGVMNPLYLSAEVLSLTEIHLAWAKNLNNEEVILAWSGSDSIGDPQHGTMYEAGQSLPGGGTIVYKGNQTSFTHSNLEAATLYYYKIWSFNDSMQYSSGKNTSAQTLCEIITSLPFEEDFNTASTVPFCWEVSDNQGNGQVWIFGNFNNQVSGTTGNVAYLNSAAYGYGNSQNSDLITSEIDLTNFSDVSIGFKHYFRQYGSASLATLSYSIDNGLTWIDLNSWTSTTSNPSIFNMPVPDVAGQDAVRFKWNYSGTWGYYWSFDDVMITGVYSAPSSSFSAEPTIALVGDVITFSDQIGGSNYTSWEWDFGAGADPQTATGQGPHEVVYYTNGYKTVGLLLDGVYSEIKTDYVSVDEAVNVFNEDFEPAIASASLPPGWEIKRNYLSDGGLDGSNLLTVHTDTWFVNTTSEGLTPPEKYIYQGQASLAIDYTSPGFSWAITPEISIPDVYSVDLSFWLWYAYNDGQGDKPTNFYLNVLDNDVWFTLASWIGQSNNMFDEQVVIDLSAYAGKTLRLAFIYENTGGYPLAIDEVMISSEAPEYWVWIGSENTDWNNAANWTKGVPEESSEVIILPCEKNPVINSDLTLNRLTIAADATMFIAQGGKLSVSGEIINNAGNAGLILESGTTPVAGEADASLIHTSPGVGATVKRHISDAPMAWHQLSSPVFNQLIPDETPGNFNDGNFYAWHEPAQTWVSYTNTIVWPTWSNANGGDGFVAGKGYMVAYDNNPVKEFSGELNQGTINFDLTRQAHPDDNPGFNLAGNPYPSSIDWKAVNGWDRTKLSASGNPTGYTVWIWNPSYGQYGTYHSGSLGDYGTNEVGRYIAPMQGFWVKAAEDGIMSFSNAVRVHSPQHWLKGSGTDSQILKLVVSSDESHYRDETVLEFGHENSEGGAEKMFSMNNTAPGLYSMKEDKSWSMNFLSNTTENPYIPLGFKPGVSAVYTLNIIGYEAFESVFLQDLQTGLSHDFSRNPSYSFISNTGDNTNRFILHFDKESTGSDSFISDRELRFFMHENNLNVITNLPETHVGIYDLSGRLLSEYDLSSPGTHQLPMRLAGGIYVVRIIAGNITRTGKVLVH